MFKTIVHTSYTILNCFNVYFKSLKWAAIVCRVYSVPNLYQIKVQTTFKNKNSFQLKLESFYTSFCTVNVHLLVHTMWLVFLKVETTGLFLPLRLELLAVAGKETFFRSEKVGCFHPLFSERIRGTFLMSVKPHPKLFSLKAKTSPGETCSRSAESCPPNVSAPLS